MEPFHKFIDHTADVLFVARAEDLPELFEQCAFAVEETMINIKKIKSVNDIKILCENKKIDGLLFDFMDELVFFKDYKQLVFSKFDITIKENEGVYNLACIAHGEKIDVVRHEPKVDVKAVTRHLFEVIKDEQSWKAKVLLDI